MSKIKFETDTSKITITAEQIVIEANCINRKGD
jgi:hypothetical protein